jgi:hypothetical protein
MLTLIEIYEHSANFVSNSGYSVEVTSGMGWVAIINTDPETENVFLQGDDAHVFISEATRLHKELQHITLNTIYLALAEPYIECLG